MGVKTKKWFKDYRETLGYEIESGIIKIYYRDGREITDLYTKEKEIEILNNMKEELISSNYIDENKTLIGLTSIGALLPFIAAIMQGTLCISRAIKGDFDCTNLPLFISNGMLSLMNSAELIEFGLNIKNIKKGNLFIENEKIVNDMLEANVEMLENKIAPSRELELYKELGSPKLTINNIDDIPLWKLKQIVKYIKEDNGLGIGSTKSFNETLTTLEKAKKKRK